MASKTSRNGKHRPLFDVIRHERVGTVTDEPGDHHPVVTGFMLAAECMTEGSDHLEFTFEGRTYHATVEDADSSLDMAVEDMANVLRGNGYEVYGPSVPSS